MSESVWLGLGVLAVAVSWAGYYSAIGLAWRAGVSRAPLILASIAGVCGCFGVPILGWLWMEFDKKLLDAPGEFDAERWRRTRSYMQIAIAIAVVGLVGVVVVGRCLPD